MTRFRSAAWIIAAAWLTGSARADTGRHFVWRITNAQAPVYLVGWLHAMRNSDFPLPGVIDHAIVDSRAVLFEIDPGASEAPLLDRRLSEAGSYSGKARLQDKVQPKTFELIRQIAQVRMSEYERRKPWAIAYFMLSRPGVTEFSTKLSVETYIYNRVRGRAQLGGLETPSGFIRAFAEMPDHQSEAFLLESVDYARRCPQLLLDTDEVWRRGDVAGMYRLYAPRRRSSGYWHWLEKRQVAWMPRIEAAIRSGKPTTIVAGSLHFCGPRSVLNLLRQRGYKLEQL